MEIWAIIYDPVLRNSLNKATDKICQRGVVGMENFCGEGIFLVRGDG